MTLDTVTNKTDFDDRDGRLDKKFLKMGHSRPLFLYFHLFSEQKFIINFADDWIRTADHWYWMRLFCQLPQDKKFSNRKIDNSANRTAHEIEIKSIKFCLKRLWKLQIKLVSNSATILVLFHFRCCLKTSNKSLLRPENK